MNRHFARDTQKVNEHMKTYASPQGKGVNSTAPLNLTPTSSTIKKTPINISEILLRVHKDGRSERLTTPSVGKDVNPPELSRSAGRRVKWYDHLGQLLM